METPMSATTKITSPGLAFMLAADNGMPSTLGDRLAIASMGEALLLALRCKMKFAKDDMPDLMRLRRQTCVGVFRPTDEQYYRAACVAGGTFAGAWEKYKQTKPWIAPEVLERSNAEVMPANRVAVGLAVLISSEEDADLASFRGKQIWWCTSMQDDEVVLCRYHCAAHDTPLVPRGKPARIKKLTRQEWAAQFPQETRSAA